jgi:DNA-binding IclR family transcriptional regulator
MMKKIAPSKSARGKSAPKKVVRGKKPRGKQDRHFVTALARGLEVMACFRHGEKLLGNQELAKRCGLPKSTISRLTHTLTSLDYLVFDDSSNKYGLGMATLGLGSSMLARLDVRKVARPLMQPLADFGHCLVGLGSRDRLSMVYIEAARGESAVTLSLDVGSRVQIATSAMGRAYLASIAASERDVLLERVRKLDASAWPKVRRGVDKSLKDLRTLGCCCSFGEWQSDVNAIAVPIRPGGGLPPMAINCGAPSYAISPEFLLEKVRPRLIALVRQVEESLGSRE